VAPDEELQLNPVMVSPLQQELEIAKANAGKSSAVIDKLLNQENVGKEPSERNEYQELLSRLLALSQTRE